MPDLIRDQLQTTLGSTYTLERELGGGGMSRVFVAEDVRLRRRIVVKLLPRELAGAVSLERFEREIATAARLQHPHIVPVLGAGEVEGLPYFTMPFVEGESLRARLARPDLEVRETISILRDVAKALAYAHGHGVVHRDIKPENILLTGGAATVTDFGVAKALSSATSGHDGVLLTAGLTGLGVALGTPAYMSPEQAAADPGVDPRSDLYAWGVLAYEMLAGQPPFAGRSPSATMAAHVSELPPPLGRIKPGLSPALATLVMACLAKRPENRPASAQTVIDALEGLTTPGAGIRAARPHAVPRTVIATVAIALVTVLGGWFAWSRHDVGKAPAAPQRRRVVVAPLENLTGDSTLGIIGRMAADWITQGMALGDSTEVVSTATVAMAAAEAKGSYAEMVRRLARTTGATALVSGSVIRRGDSLMLQAQLTDPHTGELIGTMNPVTGSANDPMHAIDALRERVLGALVSYGNGVPGDWQVQPPTFSAYREFIDGTERFQRLQDYRAALPYFRRAVELDSTFSTALGMLAVTHLNLGELAAADSLTRRLDRKRDHAGTVGRLMLDWQLAVLRGDWDETVRLQQTLAARDPADPLPQYLIGLDANRRLRTDLAIRALTASDSAMVARGWAPQLMILAEAYHQAGRHADELATAVRGRRIFPAQRNLLARALRAYAALHRPLEALALADTVLATSIDTLARDLGNVLVAAAEFRAHGDSATARALAERVLKWHMAHPMLTVSPSRAERVGAAWREAGRLDSAERYLTVAARDTACCAVASLAAVRFVRTGDRAALLRVADSLGASRQKLQFGASRYAQAGLVALLDRERAMTILRQAVQEGYSMSALHYSPLLEPLRGYAPFEEFVTPRR